MNYVWKLKHDAFFALIVFGLNCFVLSLSWFGKHCFTNHLEITNTSSWYYLKDIPIIIFYKQYV